MKRIFTSAIIATAIIFTLGVTGCNTGMQAFNHVAGDMFYTKVGLPISSTSSIGIVAAVGRIDATEGVTPVSTNRLYAPPLAVVSVGKGKQGVSAGTSTNTAATVSDSGYDTSAFSIGGATVKAQTSTNDSSSINQ